MKNFKKLAGILLALVMVLTMTTSAFAADIVKNPADLTGPASITVAIPATDNTDVYKIYKVFDAVSDGNNISYTLVDGKTVAPAGFTVDAAGNVSYAGDENATELTTADIEAIKGYVTEDMLVATVTTVANEASFTVADLPYGYYYITTTTGTLVTVNSTHPNANVQDKNTAPTVEKTITDTDASEDNLGSIDDEGKNAIAQVGKVVTYTATITVGNGATNYDFHDQMDATLAFTGAENVTVTDNDDNVTDPTAGVEYTVDAAPADGHTFDIAFDDDYIESLASGTVITITYTATVTSDALQVDAAENTAFVTYGDPTTGVNSTPSDSANVYNAKFTVTKTDGSGNALENAGFVVMNAAGKYYNLTDGVVTWVDSIDDASEHFSDAEGNVPAFTGLANGTYTLVESTVPAGYNKAADSTFTIAEKDVTVTNLEQAKTVVNNAGSVLPSTGGIGTTIFYISGAVLAIAAVVFLVTKKRMSGEEE